LGQWVALGDIAGIVQHVGPMGDTTLQSREGLTLALLAIGDQGNLEAIGTADQTGRLIGSNSEGKKASR